MLSSKQIDNRRRCRICRAVATHGRHDYREIAVFPGNPRQFVELEEKLGCEAHKQKSYTTYLDGRVLDTDQCVPETMPFQKPHDAE